MNKVNLDALIPREDFEAKDELIQDSSDKSDKIKLSELEEKGNFLYPALRKPDFQRETNEWTPDKNIGLIESFVNQDLIPAIIMWNTKGSFTFVIDGAHRLSALIAWVNDDYGDGTISRKFFDRIPEEQKKIADKTRKLVEAKIGSYDEYKKALNNPKGFDEQFVSRARDLSRHSIQLQWVNGGAQKAEDSFFRINQEASKINKTELTVLKSRESPNGIAARAIKNSGTGHKYWGKFSEEKQREIEKIAKEINELLFIPPYKKPICSLELPIAGRANSAQALPLILNFINIANGVIDKNTKPIKDEDGKLTIEYLNKCKKIALKINSKDTSSLGLYPAIYLYSKEGDYRTPYFYSIVALMLEFEENKSLEKKFTEVREAFEKFNSECDIIIYQMFRKYREGIKGYNHVKNFYIKVIEKLSENTSEDALNNLIEEEKKKAHVQPRDFSVSVKSTIFMREALKNAIKCKICGGLIGSKSVTIDHKQRKREQGLGTVENGQIAHPYCNNVYKH